MSQCFPIPLAHILVSVLVYKKIVQQNSYLIPQCVEIDSYYHQCRDWLIVIVITKLSKLPK